MGRKKIVLRLYRDLFFFFAHLTRETKRLRRNLKGVVVLADLTRNIGVKKIIVNRVGKVLGLKPSAVYACECVIYRPGTSGNLSLVFQ